MGRIAITVVLPFLFVTSALAQGKPQPRPLQTQPPSATSDEQAAQVKEWIELAQKRQAAVDARNTKLWERWNLAVCIGCGPLLVKYRAVYTTPGRVLAGIPAGEDDARRGLRL